MIKKRPTVSTVCAHCSKVFEKDRREIDRRIRDGKNRFFCSRSCSASGNNLDFPEARVAAAKRTLEKLRGEGRTGRKYNELSPFKYYVRKARMRSKLGTHDIDETYLKSLWEKQMGACVYSGIALTLNDPYTRERSGESNDPRFLASLDRIDSAQGYVRGNVHFISASLNLAKSTLSHEQFVEFITLIRASR
jgi:hypothetical protein